MLYSILLLFFFFFKQKTAYDMRISDWSLDVFSSDLFDENHPKKEHAKAKAEIHDRESRQHRDGNFPYRNDQRHDRADPHHAGHRRRVASMPEEHGRVIFEKMPAGQQGHGSLGDFLDRQSDV